MSTNKFHQLVAVGVVVTSPCFVAGFSSSASIQHSLRPEIRKFTTPSPHRSLAPAYHSQFVRARSLLWESSIESENEDGSSLLDEILSQLTSAFPLFVLTSAIMGLVQPKSLRWVNQGNLISTMLAGVMCGTGLTLEPSDFTNVLGNNLKAVPLGVLCQFMIMPLTAWIIGHALLLSSFSAPIGKPLFLGLLLVGCSPGGTASNLVSLIARANVALSVILTAASTILASLVTPALVKLLAGSTVEVSGKALCIATSKVVLAPVLVGMWINQRAPKLARNLSRFTPFGSVLLVSLICGGVVAQNASLFLEGTTAVLPRLISSVLLLHTVGFSMGYFIPRLGFRQGEQTARTISIETGMQNSALAVVLARSIGAPALAGLPGALSATTHSCLGSLMAAYWRRVVPEPEDNSEPEDANNYQI